MASLSNKILGNLPTPASIRRLPVPATASGSCIPACLCSWDVKYLHSIHLKRILVLQSSWPRRQVLGRLVLVWKFLLHLVRLLNSLKIGELRLRSLQLWNQIEFHCDINEYINHWKNLRWSVERNRYFLEIDSIDQLKTLFSDHFHSNLYWRFQIIRLIFCR